MNKKLFSQLQILITFFISILMFSFVYKYQEYEYITLFSISLGFAMIGIIFYAKKYYKIAFHLVTIGISLACICIFKYYNFTAPSILSSDTIAFQQLCFVFILASYLYLISLLFYKLKISDNYIIVIYGILFIVNFISIFILYKNSILLNQTLWIMGIYLSITTIYVCIITCCRDEIDDEKNIMFAYFIIFGFVFILALIIVSEGQLFDGLAGGSSGGSNSEENQSKNNNVIN